jgi:hypothetical protein
VLLNKDMAGKLEHMASEKADKTSKEADRVSAETRRLASKEAGRDGWGRGRWWKGDEKEEGAEAPSSHGNQRKSCIWRRENGEYLEEKKRGDIFFFF